MSNEVETQALQSLKKHLAEFDSKMREGRTEVIKLLLTAATVLLSFIAITSTKDMTYSCLVKAAAVCISFTFIFGFYLFYFTNVSLNKAVIKEISTSIQNSNSASEAFDRVKEISQKINFAAKHGLLLSFVSFGAALGLLITRLFLAI